MRVMTAASQSGAVDLAACLRVAEDAAREAGRIVCEALAERRAGEPASTTIAPPEAAGVEEKKNWADLVTASDRECERVVVAAIRKAFPDHAIVGEEETAANGGVIPEITDEPTWCVDPIDGTTNFVHGFPFVCVCIGLLVKQTPVVGVVFNPMLGECFTARVGQGAKLNGAPIRVSSTPNLKQAVVGAEFGIARDGPSLDATFRSIGAVLSRCRAVRMAGSCACAITSVACGRLDAFYERGYGGPWDVCAALCILTEAGGIHARPWPDDQRPFAFAGDDRENAILACCNAGVLGEIKEAWAQGPPV